MLSHIFMLFHNSSTDWNIKTVFVVNAFLSQINHVVSAQQTSPHAPVPMSICRESYITIDVTIFSVHQHDIAILYPSVCAVHLSVCPLCSGILCKRHNIPISQYCCSSK